jgi:alkylation response protein AidB-like acyl-CoA dehydrogenase
MLEPSTEVLERARALAPTIAAGADEIERLRRLPDTLAAALHRAGMFRLLLPRSLGGTELEPASFVQVTETLSRVDASTAWVVCQTSGCSMTAAYLRPDVAREIFGGEPVGVLAWGPPAGSKAVVVDGGYRLSGTFNFASGSHPAPPPRRGRAAHAAVPGGPREDAGCLAHDRAARHRQRLVRGYRPLRAARAHLLPGRPGRAP